MSLFVQLEASAKKNRAVFCNYMVMPFVYALKSPLFKWKKVTKVHIIQIMLLDHITIINQ